MLVDFLGKMESNLAPAAMVVDREAEPKNLALLYNADLNKSGSRQRLWGLDLSSTYQPSLTFWSPAVAEKYKQSRLGSSVSCHLAAATTGFDPCVETPGGSNDEFGFFPSEQAVAAHGGQVGKGAGNVVPGPFLSLSCAPITLEGVMMMGGNGGLGNY